MGIKTNISLRLNSYRCFWKNQRGFTFIEVIVASVILGIVIIGIVTLFTSGHTIALKQKRSRAALTVVEGIMEQRFSTVSSGQFTSWYSNNGYLDTNLVIQLSACVYSRAVIYSSGSYSVTCSTYVKMTAGTDTVEQDGGGTAICPIYTVDITALWNESGNARSVTLSRIVANP